jgi:hypothetical protein
MVRAGTSLVGNPASADDELNVFQKCSLGAAYADHGAPILASMDPCESNCSLAVDNSGDVRSFADLKLTHTGHRQTSHRKKTLMQKIMPLGVARCNAELT